MQVDSGTSQENEKPHQYRLKMQMGLPGKYDVSVIWKKYQNIPEPTITLPIVSACPIVGERCPLLNDKICD